MVAEIEKIKDWILSKNAEASSFDDDYNIIENGILDSLHFMELIYLIEELSGKEINLKEITIDSFSTINSINEKFF